MISEEKKYNFVEKLGCGCYGVVFLVKANDSSEEEYAAKQYFNPNSNFIEHEENMLKSINSPNVIKYIDSGTNKVINYEDFYFTIMELCVGYELFEYYACLGLVRGFEENIGKLLFAEILKGVQDCHSSNICHRDLKNDNIMINENNYQIKICDFGTATKWKDDNNNIIMLNDNIFKIHNINEKNLQDKKIESNGYQAPELFQKNPSYSGEKVDVFSLGALLYEIVTGKRSKLRFLSNINKENYEKLIEISLKDPSFASYSQEFKSLYKKMVAYNPQDRPSLDNIIKEEPFMKEVRDFYSDSEKEKNAKKYINMELKKRTVFIKRNKEFELNTEGIDYYEQSYGAKGDDDFKEFYKSELIPKIIIKPTRKMRDFIKIKGNFEPYQFMNKLRNVIEEKFEKECKCKFDENEFKDGNYNKLKFSVVFYGEIPNGEEEDILNINGTDTKIKVKMYGTLDGYKILAFYKIEGCLEEYDKYLEKIKDEVKNILQNK